MALELYPSHLPSTVNRHAITPARAVLYHAHELGWRPPMRVRLFRHPRSKKHQPVDAKWMTAFLAQADGDKLFHLSALVLFMQHTAARVSEGLGVLGQHVDLRRRTVLLVKTKTDTHVETYLTDELVFRLHSLGLADDKPVFRYTSRFSVNERLRAVCSRAGIEYRPTHSVGRHSFATNALKYGLGIKTAMDAGRWKSATIFLETYAHTEHAGRKVADEYNRRRYENL